MEFSYSDLRSIVNALIFQLHGLMDDKYKTGYDYNRIQAEISRVESLLYDVKTQMMDMEVDSELEEFHKQQYQASINEMKQDCL